MNLPKRLWIPAAGVLAAALIGVPAANLYYRSSSGRGCARCHEISFSREEWSQSAHRNINCMDCHASSLQTNVRRVAAHATGAVPDQVHLGTADVLAMQSRCQGCHRQEFAQWAAGGHSATYARLFLDREHNRKRLLADDCLRCHGMHYDGGIPTLVEPVSATGPWRLKDSGLASQPAIPCLACHSIHRIGLPLSKPGERVGAGEELMRPGVGFFDRRTRMNIAGPGLGLPAIYQGTRAVRLSPDPRQAICYQCHAPLADAQAWSGDDRTPLGVHEGLSCLACHQTHGEWTRRSCADCHPRLSNCGIDVEKMDTTFRNPRSAHNVHTVKCVDCHVKGVPKKKAG
jgi:hypothetical protein